MVAPPNELIKDILNDGIISVTVHRFFGCGITEESRSRPFDDSQFDVIVFDDLSERPASLIQDLQIYQQPPREKHPGYRRYFSK